MDNKSTKRKQVLVIFLVLVVLLSACSVSVVYYVKNYISEGVVEDAPVALPSKSDIPDKDGFPYYLSDLLIAPTGDSNVVKTDFSTDVSIDKDSITFDGKANSDVVKYIVGSLSGKICEYYSSHEGDFGDNFNFNPDFPLKSESISLIDFKQGEVNPEDENTANEEDFYYFTVEAVNGLADENKAENLRFYSSENLKSSIIKVTDSFAEMLEADNLEVNGGAIKVEGKTDRLKDKLQSLKLSADYDVKLNISFKGDYAQLGSCAISFKLTVTENYNYSWAGVEIEKDTMYLTLNAEDTLPLAVKLSDKATRKDYKIHFESENDKQVSVDKDGNIKGLRLSDKPVKVTVVFEYLGAVYTDSCDVYVTIPVKRIKTQPEKITLGVGEKEKLTCTITPDDATIKTLEWHSEDEKIAVVSDDGTVTAVGGGKVKVYAVSTDGYFRSSCVVSVEEVK